MPFTTHHDPTGPFGYAPDGSRWDTEASEALERAQNFAQFLALALEMLELGLGEQRHLLKKSA